MFENAFKDSLADGGRIGFDNGTQIRGDKGLYLSISDPNNPQRPKWLKYKELVEEANKGFEFITTIKDANLREQAGLPRKAGRNIAKWRAELDIPELNSLETQIKRYIQFMQSDLNAPASKFFDFRKKLVGALKIDQGLASFNKILKTLPEYREIIPVINKLGIAASKARLSKNNNTIGDVFNMVENRPIPTDYRNISQSPEKFILESVERHIKQGGKKVAYTKKPGTLDATGKLITDTDAEFTYKGKKYSFDDLSTKGRKLKVFDEIYKAFDLRDQLFDTEVIDPRTNKKIKFIDLAKDAYNVGAGYGYVKPPYEIDHGKSVAKEPFKFIRIIPRRINQAAGIVDEKILQKTFLTPEKKKIYTKKNVEQIKKTIGYNFDKTIDQLKNDELKLFKQILVPSDRYPDGRKLRSPVEIGMKSIGTYLDSKKSIITNRLNSGIPIDSILSTIAEDLNIPVEQVKKVAGKTLKAFGKVAGAVEPVFAAMDASEAFTKGASGEQAANYVVGRFFEGIANLPALAKGGFDFAIDKARGEDAKFEMPYEATFAQDYLKNVLEQTPKEVLEARKAQLEFDQNVLPGMTMVDDMDMPASKAEIEAAKNKFMNEKGVDLSVLDEPKPDKTFNQFLANGGRVNFSEGGTDNFAAELEYYLTNPDAELPKMQTFEETLNPIVMINDMIDPRNYPFYADQLVQGGIRVGEFATRILPATGKLISDLVRKPAFKITGASGQGYVQDYDELPQGANIKGTGIFSNFLENITPTATEKKLGLDKLIEAEEQKMKDRGSTIAPKVLGETLSLGVEFGSPIFPGIKLLKAYANANKLPVDNVTKELLEKEVDKVLTERGTSRRKFLQTAGAGASLMIAKMLGLGDETARTAKVAEKTVAETATGGGVPPYFFQLVEKIKKNGTKFESEFDPRVENNMQFENFALRENLSTGEITITKSTEGGVSAGDDIIEGTLSEEAITYNPGEVIMGRDGRPMKTPVEYEEITVRPDMEGKMKDAEPGLDSIEEIIELLGPNKLKMSELEAAGYNVNAFPDNIKNLLIDDLQKTN